MLLYRLLPSRCPYEGLLPFAENPRGIREPGRSWLFFLPGAKIGVFQIKMEEASKQYMAFTIGNLGFFQCDHIPFGLCSALAMFQRMMQNCLGKLNLIYCPIYLDDIVIFLWMAEEHLHWLWVVFD